ncbi:hypothetical protein Tco_0812637 [Tanacetum coccineum]
MICQLLVSERDMFMIDLIGGLTSRAASMSSAHPCHYTWCNMTQSIGRVFWGADEEISDGDVPRVIVYGYDGLPMQPVAPPSPDYVPGPEHPPSPIEIPYCT